MQAQIYTPPVFHTEHANEQQMKVMQIVFDTLKNSGVRFCIVRRTDRADELKIEAVGDFDLNEKGEIVREVVEMYIDGDEINHIYTV